MRLCSSVADMGCTELLLQADDTSSMVRWLKALQEQALEAQAPLSAEEVSGFYYVPAMQCHPCQSHWLLNNYKIMVFIFILFFYCILLLKLHIY